MIDFKTREIIKSRYEHEGFYDVNETTDLRHDPYWVADWTKYFTPIEQNVWSDIRSQTIVFLPQYQVGKYYPDFANPVLKIIIEVDGKQHNKPDQKKHDAYRDKWLMSQGWRVFRIKGSETFSDYQTYYGCDGEKVRDLSKDEALSVFDSYITESSEGFFHALNVLLGVRSEYSGIKMDICYRGVGMRAVGDSSLEMPKFVEPRRKSQNRESILAEIGRSIEFERVMVV